MQAFRELATKVSESKQRIAQGEVKKQTSLRVSFVSIVFLRTLVELQDDNLVDDNQ